MAEVTGWELWAVLLSGNTGASVGGIRVGGKSGHQSAFTVMGERKYKDFQDDRIIEQSSSSSRRCGGCGSIPSRQDLPQNRSGCGGTIDKNLPEWRFLQVVMGKTA